MKREQVSPANVPNVSWSRFFLTRLRQGREAWPPLEMRWASQAQPAPSSDSGRASQDSVSWGRFSLTHCRASSPYFLNKMYGGLCTFVLILRNLDGIVGCLHVKQPFDLHFYSGGPGRHSVSELCKGHAELPGIGSPSQMKRTGFSSEGELCHENPESLRRTARASHACISMTSPS